MGYTVYVHINKVNGKMYFGITSQTPSSRWGKDGKKYLRNGQPKFTNAIKKYGWDNFEHRVLGSNFTEEQAKKLEMIYIKLFNTVENGYNISLGGDGCTKYTDAQLLELTKQYKTVKEFREQNGSLYQLCWERGVLKQTTWFRHYYRWNYESCYKEAQKYTLLIDFRKYSRGAYGSALKNGWLCDYTWLKHRKPTGYWTYDICLQEASQYTKRSAFKKGNAPAYKAAWKNKWLDDFFPS